MLRHSSRLEPFQAQGLNERIDVRPDFPKPGILFRDVGPLLRDARSFAVTIDAMCAPYQCAHMEDVEKCEVCDNAPTLFAGVESRGFIFAAAMAIRLGVGFVPIRKAGKLPGPVSRQTYSLEYGTATIELQLGAVKVGERVVVVDDLLATGGTAKAAGELLKQEGAYIVACDFVIELADLRGREVLSDFHNSQARPALVNALLTF